LREKEGRGKQVVREKDGKVEGWRAGKIESSVRKTVILRMKNSKLKDKNLKIKEEQKGL